MENKKIFELMDKFSSSGLTGLLIKSGDFEIEMKKDGIYQASEVKTDKAHETDAVKQTVIEPVADSGKVITSPIVGTYYAASSPEKPPFVTEGSRVQKGDTVCVVEAMKMFNEVSSDFDGVVKEILVKNGDNIEYGQKLIVLE